MSNKAPPELSQLTSVEILRQVWLQQYTWVDGSMVWRLPSTTGLPACKQMIASPYDPQARNRTKRDTNWTGYTVHLTETCDQDRPHLITNVETTPRKNLIKLASPCHERG